MWLLCAPMTIFASGPDRSEAYADVRVALPTPLDRASPPWNPDPAQPATAQPLAPGRTVPGPHPPRQIAPPGSANGGRRPGGVAGLAIRCRNPGHRRSARGVTWPRPRDGDSVHPDLGSVGTDRGALSSVRREVSHRHGTRQGLSHARVTA